MQHTNLQTHAPPPSRSIAWGSVLLPVVKCAICPTCLSLFGSLFAGAHLGFLGDERVHGALLAATLISEPVILRLAMRHHKKSWPLVVCLLGAGIVALGHLAFPALEYAGFAFLIVASLSNLLLLRRQHTRGNLCCGPPTVTAGVAAVPRSSGFTTPP